MVVLTIPYSPYNSFPSKRAIIIPEKSINALPIPLATANEKKAIVECTNILLRTKKANPLADTSALEAEIDRLVYDLYGLTENEIAIVEGTN